MWEEGIDGTYNLYLAELEVHPPSFERREVKQLVDHGEESLRMSIDGVEPLAILT